MVLFHMRRYSMSMTLQVCVLLELLAISTKTAPVYIKSACITQYLIDLKQNSAVAPVEKTASPLRCEHSDRDCIANATAT